MRQVLLRLGVGSQRLPVALIRSQAIELDQRQGKVVRSLFRQEIPHQRATTSSDYWRPCCGVALEVSDPVRIERIANAAGDHVSTVYCVRSRLVSRGTPSPTISDLKCGV